MRHIFILKPSRKSHWNHDRHEDVLGEGVAVMGGAQSAKTILQIQTATLKAKGKVFTEEEENELHEVCDFEIVKKI